MANLLNYPPVILGISLILLWLSTRLGDCYERKARPLKDEEREHLTTAVGATLTLLGLIVGFTFSMAITRYDQRKNYEEEEANAIGTEYLRLDLLPAESAQKAKDLLRKYLVQRIAYYEERYEGNMVRIDDETGRLQGELWSVVQAVAVGQPTPTVALAASGMNDVLNSQGYTQASWWNRIPEGAWLLMFIIAMCSCTLTGYSARHSRPWLLVILPIVLSISFFFIADIDSPRHGVIRVTPRNLISLEHSLRKAS